MEGIEVVAAREFTDENGENVTLIVGKPDPDPAPGGDWRCPIVLAGPALPGRIQYICGLDSLQALVLALGIAKATVDYTVRTHGALRWNEDLDLGLDYEMLSRRPESA